MDSNTLSNIRQFCKNNTTVGIPIQKLFKNYRNNPKYAAVTQHEFETGLALLDKRVMQNLMNDVEEFIFKHHGNYTSTQAHRMFIEQYQSVTVEFWGLYFKNRPGTFIEEKEPEALKVSDFADQLPVDWLTMTLPERIDFAHKIDQKDFLEFVMSLDVKLSTYMKASRRADKKEAFKLKLYVTIFSFPADSASEEAKQLLKKFVESLNQLGRARLQYMECSNPPTVEIREVRS